MNSKPSNNNKSFIQSFTEFKTPNPKSMTTFNSNSLDDESSIHSEIDNNYFEIFRDILKNKREAKELRKIHEEMFENYVSSLGYVNMKTAKGYCRIISKFLLYSPSVDPDELEPFLIKEFKIKQKSGTLYQNLKGTSLNYYRCINAFLKSVYSSGYSELSPHYAASIKHGFKNNETFVSL